MSITIGPPLETELRAKADSEGFRRQVCRPVARMDLAESPDRLLHLCSGCGAVLCARNRRAGSARGTPVLAAKENPLLEAVMKLHPASSVERNTHQFSGTKDASAAQRRNLDSPTRQ